MADDDTSRKGGRGKGGGGGKDGGKPREDSVQEIVIAGALERLAGALGESASQLLPEHVRSAALKYAGKKNIPGAIGVLSVFAQTFAGDEEARGAVRGFIDGFGKAITETPEAELEKKMRSYLDGSEHLKAITSHAAQGRFRDLPKMPYGEAFSFLSPEDKAQVLKLVMAFPVDQIDLGAARFSPRELMAIAAEVQELGADAATKLRFAQFKKPDSKAKELGKQGDEIVKQLRETLDKLFAPKPGERPLEERLRNRANQQISSADAFERAINAVNERHRSKPIPGYVWVGIAAGLVLIAALIGISQSLGH